MLEPDTPKVVSVINDFNRLYLGKTKAYIIEKFPYPPTDIKHLDSDYEILVFKRYRNSMVGNGITTFHMKNGICYKIQTNEYNLK